MVVSRMGTDGHRQPVAIHYRHDFNAFSTLGLTNFVATTLRRRKNCINETLRFINITLSAKRVGKVGQYHSQNVTSAPLLKATMHRFIVREALRQHMPLSTGIQNPQYRIEHLARLDQFAAGAIIGNIFFWKMPPNSLPLFISKFLHASAA
jgi:hypothetical protein